MYRVFSIKSNGYPILVHQSDNLAAAESFATDYAKSWRLVSLNETCRLEIHQVITTVLSTIKI